MYFRIALMLTFVTSNADAVMPNYNPECPGGRPMYCVLEACTNAKCPAQTGAKCKSKCNGCIAEFFDKYKNDVTNKCKCRHDQRPATCIPDPCDKARCDTPGECRTDRCGGCDAVFYDRWANVIPSCPIKDQSGGICPKPKIGVCADLCGPNSCSRPQLCCSNGCGHQCMDPYFPDCPGGKPLACKPPACDVTNCPKQIQARCLRPTCFGCIPHFFDQFDNEVTENCDCKPPGLPPVNCVDDPCRTAKCPKRPDAVCRTDTCGACTARFYDNRGREVECKYSGSGGTCPNNIRPKTSGHCDILCRQDTDCREGQKCCSIGCRRVCMRSWYKNCDARICITSDCFGYSCATHTQARCEPVQCTCSALFIDTFGNDITAQCRCPGRISEAKCPSNLCRRKTCHAHPDAECRINRCGTCKIEFFDSRGKEVRCDGSDGTCPNIRPETSGHCDILCRRDTDCRGRQKCCSIGCRRICMNPLPESCDAIRCIRNACIGSSCAIHTQARCEALCNTCFPLFVDTFGNDITAQCNCPWGISEARCPDNLCRGKTCHAHPDAECRINRCGTCKIEFFDSRGKEVECDVPSKPRCPPQIGGRAGNCGNHCKRDSNCPRGQICCSNGCGRVCKAPLPDNCDSSICFANACDVTSCARHTQARCQAACGTCHPLFFDEFKNDITANCPCPGRIFEAECDDDLCRGKTCKNHREVECRINRCGGCKIEFFDKKGTKVDCKRGSGFELDPRCPAVRQNPHGACGPECYTNADCRRNQICCSNGCGIGTRCQNPPLGLDLDPRCPAVRHDRPGACSQECSSNADCRRNQICCSNGCGTQCQNPPSRVELDPRCPAVRHNPAGACGPECYSNADCRRNQICCSNGCGPGTKCQNPPLGLDPRCPAVRQGQVGACSQQCSSNGDCRRNQICCSNGCGTQCRNPPLDDRCPPPDPKIIEKLPFMFCIAPQCFGNGDCKGDDVCCSDGCTARCISPPLVDPRCLKDDGVVGPCINLCNSNKDCSRGKICCRVGCGTQCRNINQGPSDGYDKRCIRPVAPVSELSCSKRCSRNRECRSDHMCCGLYCGSHCTPKPRTCDPGEFLAKCTNLCDRRSCANHPKAKCRVHGCNGCKYEFFDEHNRLVKDCIDLPIPIGR